MIIVIISEVTIILQRERIFLLASHCLNIHVMSMSDFLLRKSLHTSGWHKNSKLYLALTWKVLQEPGCFLGLEERLFLKEQFFQ